jgi:hypothetical protein
VDRMEVMETVQVVEPAVLALELEMVLLLS